MAQSTCRSMQGRFKATKEGSQEDDGPLLTATNESAPIDFPKVL